MYICMYSTHLIYMVYARKVVLFIYFLFPQHFIYIMHFYLQFALPEQHIIVVLS